MIHEPSDQHVDAHPQVHYFSIFIALCICTALSVLFDVVHLTPKLLVFFVLAVAIAKAMFVMTYFMHLKFEGKWKFIILAPTTILALGLVIALAPDMAMHYYASDAPQVRAFEAAAEGLNPPPPQTEPDQMSPGGAQN
ncbi:cytochrome C oxidase subunit IV family protein [Planctomicrobium piriforme]|uniref:Cytochrome c oxidase subunit 4 n=1 Tax=Planctomicrobium piriforme TaxID=1576369 RepID=A0A1I3CYL0_9PLAN|nr:cytochrome C oxidase subunit IV family protein [Planctomicrobium piriforme]SFH79640.1 cytochrome c oxidase subunit 4 [Planctomicrobium piriforme]